MTVGELISGDVERAIYNWAKESSAISAAFHGQIHFEVPGKTPPFPLLTIESAGGGPTVVLGEGLIEETIVSLSCWAKPFDKATSARCAAVVKTAAFNLYREPYSTLVGDGVVTLQGAGAGTTIWSPDPRAGYARYVVSTVFTTTTIAVS